MSDFEYVLRDFEDAVRSAALRSQALVILGPRRAGKTTMLKHLVRGRQCLWFSGKDEDDLKVLADSQSCLSLMRQFPNIIIDEAQFFPDIGRVIKEMVENTTTDSRIFVIGSSKLAFGVPLGQSGGDRIDSFTLWPLVLEELARRNGWDDVKRDIYDRMIYGCYPTVINDPAHAREFLIDMADTLLHRDLFQLAEVRKKMDLERLLAVLAAKVGSVIHYGAIARELGIENKTIERYVELLAACFIVRVVPSWYGQSPAELRLSKKIYFYDNGVRNALLRDFTPVPARKDKEVLWENLFFTERLKRHAVRRDGGEIYFWRTKKDHEMDFVEVVNGTIVAFACRAGGKSDGSAFKSSIKAFMRAYPNIPVTVATPETIDREPEDPVRLETAVKTPGNAPGEVVGAG